MNFYERRCPLKIQTVKRVTIQNNFKNKCFFQYYSRKTSQILEHWICFLMTAANARDHEWNTLRIPPEIMLGIGLYNLGLFWDHETLFISASQKAKIGPSLFLHVWKPFLFIYKIPQMKERAPFYKGWGHWNCENRMGVKMLIKKQIPTKYYLKAQTMNSSFRKGPQWWFNVHLRNIGVEGDFKGYGTFWYLGGWEYIIFKIICFIFFKHL